MSFPEPYSGNSFAEKERMSTIIQQPDSLSFSGNLKKFVITTAIEMVFELWQLTNNGDKLILNEKYYPNPDGLLTVDVKAIVDRLLFITIPGNEDKVNDQPIAVGDFLVKSKIGNFIKCCQE